MAVTSHENILRSRRFEVPLCKGGFSSAYEIPPDPPLNKGGRGTGTVRFPPQPIGFHGMQSRSPSDRWLRTFWMKIAQFRLQLWATHNPAIHPKLVPSYISDSDPGCKSTNVAEPSDARSIKEGI